MTQEDFEKKLNKSEEWLIRGKKCSVVIKHRTTHEIPGYDIPMEHCWTMYAIIPPNNKYWMKACDNKTDYDTDLGNKLYNNFHGGCTFYNKQLTYVKIGCDYMHCSDDYYIRSSEMPEEIKDDALDLFNYFEKE